MSTGFLILMLTFVNADGRKDVFSKPPASIENRRTIEDLIKKFFKNDPFPRAKLKHVYPLYFDAPVDKYRNVA